MSDGASSALRAAHLYLPESEPSFTQFPSLVRASTCSGADPPSKTSNSVLELEGLYPANVTDEGSFKTAAAPPIIAACHNTAILLPHITALPHQTSHHVFRNYRHHCLVRRQAAPAQAQVVEHQHRHGPESLLAASGLEVRRQGPSALLPVWPHMHSGQLLGKGFLPARRQQAWHRHCVPGHITQCAAYNR